MAIEVGRPVGWEPKTKAQQALLDSIGIVDFILFGGAAGSLKTETILVDAAQEYQNPNLHALIVRKTFKEIELDIEPKSYRLYPQMGATYNTSKRRWEWPWGAAIQFGYFETMKDCGRYFGPEFSLIDFDESTFHTEEVVRWLITMRMRSRDPSLKLRARLATNPGQIGAHWHKSIFMGPHCTHCRLSPESKIPWRIYKDAVWPSDNVTIMGSDNTPMTTMYIPGRLSDHSLLAGYENRMKGLTERMRNALLDGCWETTEGQFFDCWDYDKHVISWESTETELGLKHSLQPYFSWFASVDWGFGKSSAAAHLHVKTPNGMIYTVDEVLVKHMDAPDFANYLKMRWYGVFDNKLNMERKISAWYLSPDAWQSRGMRSDSGRSIAEQMQNASDIAFESASNDRKAGWMCMYTMLKNGMWKICGDKCPELVKALPTRVHDPDNPGDIIKVAGDPHDDIADCCLVPGTMISTEFGDVPIEAVQPYTKVWTRKGLRRVLHAWKSGVNKPTLEVKLSNGTSITGTGNHPVWVDGKGFIALDSLQPDDLIATTSAKSVPVSVVAVLPAARTDVYNLEVEGENEYFANGVLVHNCRYGAFSWIQSPKKPRSVLIAEACTSTDPHTYAMQAILANKKFAPTKSFVSYRTGKLGRA